MDDLKPCPKCGSVNISINNAIAFTIYCRDCRASTSQHRERKGAITAWNQRPQPPGSPPPHGKGGTAPASTAPQDFFSPEEMQGDASALVRDLATGGYHSYHNAMRVLNAYHEWAQAIHARTKSDAGEAVGEPAASAPPASGAPQDDLVEELRATLAVMFHYPNPDLKKAIHLIMPVLNKCKTLIAERDAALAKLERAEYGRVARGATIAELEAKLAAAEAALDPNKTKGAYMGEFSFMITQVDEEGEEFQRKVYVPWTTIKEIMVAIKARAALATEKHP